MCGVHYYFWLYLFLDSSLYFVKLLQNTRISLKTNEYYGNSPSHQVDFIIDVNGELCGEHQRHFRIFKIPNYQIKKLANTF